MNWNKTFFVFFFCAATLSWCGEAGVRPAQSHRSQQVRDLRATRTGNKVTLTWSQPRGLTGVGHLVARVCRSISSTGPAASSSSPACGQPVGEVDPGKTTNAVVSAISEKANNEVRGRFSDNLSDVAVAPDALRFVLYTVELRDDKGHSAGFSSAVSVALAPTLPARGLHSELDVRGVYLIWENDIETRPSQLQFDYRIYRSEKGSGKKVAVPYAHGIVHTRDGDRWSGVDTSIEWEKIYLYWIKPVTMVYSPNGRPIDQIEGEETGPIEVRTHDVFPPAVPEGLLGMANAIHGNRFVDLLWAPNTEKDLVGYNVYRREGDGQMVRMNSVPITMLSFQDAKVATGNKYFYSVSAIDLRGNESAKSSEVTPVLP